MESVSFGSALIVYIARMNEKNEMIKFDLNKLEIIGKLLGAKDFKLTNKNESGNSGATKTAFKKAGFRIK